MPKVREKLKEMGYKSGRISQLVGANRPSSSSGLKRPAAAATVAEKVASHNRPQGRPLRKRPAASAEAVAAPKRRVRGKQTVPAHDPPAVEALVVREDRPSKLCLGFEEGLCIFSTQVASEKARVNPDWHEGKHCVFCRQDNFQRAVATPRGKGVITAALAFFQENNEEIFELACSRVSGFTDEAALQGCLDRLARLQKKGATQEVRGRTAREKKQKREETQQRNSWKHLLPSRVSQTQFGRTEVAKYKDNTQKNALRRLSRKFSRVYRPDGRPVRAGTQWQTPLAAAFKQYAEEFSWAMCSCCCRLVPQKFHPKYGRAKTRGRSLQRTIKACKHCNRNVGYKVPQVEDVPLPLRGLTQNVLDALAILRVYTGPHEQGYQAYRVHTGAIRFSWHERSVEDRITDLPKKDWRSARPAFEWLRDADRSAYKGFLAAHHAFLRKREADIAGGDMDVDEAVKWLPLRFMETVGLECAIWPHLYWDRQMTETWVRSQDARRQARRRDAQRQQEDVEDMLLQAEEDGQCWDRESEEEAEGAQEGWEDVGRQSAKASFVAKIFSPVIGYGTIYELQHFVYDLWLASSLGGAKNAAGTTLRGAVAGKVFSPVYWETMHLALVDCVRQVGLPSLFVTVAPP